MMDVLWWWWMQITIKRVEEIGSDLACSALVGVIKHQESAPVYSVGDLKFLLEKMCSGRAI